MNEKKVNPITGFEEKSRFVQYFIKLLLRICSLLLGEKDVQFFYWKKTDYTHMQITPPKETERFDSAKWYMRF